MASSYEPSEGFFAALMFHGSSPTDPPITNFLDLHQWCLDIFADDTKVIGDKAGFMRSMMTADKTPKGRKSVLASVAQSYNGVMGLRNSNNTPYNTIPDRVYMTGKTWPQQVQKFKLDHVGMSDYNSSDVIAEYSTGKYGNKPHWVGISLKKKAKESLANPPLINNAFSNYVKDNPKLLEKIDDHRKKFFAEVIQEACKEDAPLFGLCMPGNGSGKLGKMVINMNLSNKQDVEDIWSAKYAVIKNGKQEMKALINIKQATDMVNRSGVIENSDNDSVKWVFRKFINEKLQSDDDGNPLFNGFLDIMQDKKVKDTIANSLLNRVLKLDMYNEMDVWEDNEFAFYLVVGVGDYGERIGPSYEGHTIVESLESLLVAIASVSKGEAKLVIDKKSTREASAAKVFFTLFKGDVGILDVELRYGGDFKAYPRFHANMHSDFLKRVGRAKIEVLQPLGM